MASYSGGPLSGSTNGRPIPVAATSTPGTLVHTAISGTGAFDEVYLWASNVTGSVVSITVEWGGVSDPGDHIVKSYSIPSNSVPLPLALGQRIQGGVVIRAFASTASGINITGYYNRVQ